MTTRCPLAWPVCARSKRRFARAPDWTRPSIAIAWYATAPPAVTPRRWMNWRRFMVARRRGGRHYTAARDSIGRMDGPKAPRVVAIVPAAGRSSRMGAPKQLLPVRDKPMLLGVIDAVRGGGADDVVLVTHSELREALPDLSSG